MNILLAGDWHSQVHEEPAYRALLSLGHQVSCFAWHGYFSTASTGRPTALWRRLQYKYLLGPCFSRLNADFVRTADTQRPELVFIYRGTHILPASIREIRQRVPGVTVVGYNNDDPFAPDQPRWLWRHFLGCLPEYDAALAYRHHNLPELTRHGAKQVYLLRSWFVPEFNHPVTLSAEESPRFDSDVVFAGHYEDDGRLQLLEQVAKQGFKLKLFGPPGWESAIERSRWLKALAPVRPVWGEDYNKALCGAKVALCFLSRLNRDTYTRRCFEIPATGTLMLSEYSEDLSSLFEEGQEADYFRSAEELITKLHLYLGDDSRRRAVASAGLARVWRDGHDVRSRMATLLDWLAAQNLLKQSHAGQ